LPRHFWASALALFAAITAFAGCGGGGGDVSGDAVLHVYVSLPATGDGRDARDGALMALDDAGNTAGGIRVEAVQLDAPDGPAGVGANARTATQDSTAIAYLGDFDSGASRVSVPITNAAGLLQVSPASGATDLVDKFPGSDQVPAAQSSGSRTFGRVIPGDEAQARAASAWVDRLNPGTVATVSDDTAFGKDMVDTFRDSLVRTRVANTGARLLYYGGQSGDQPQSLTQSAPRLMVTDAELVAPLSQPPRTLATSAALDPTQLPPKGQDFVKRFTDRFSREPGRYAAYGYEAMAVILDSINRASDPTDRGAVVDAFFDTADRDSILGTYSIADDGETTLDRMTGYEIDGGEVRPATELSGN
jgi:branched-chain amino acid transport system substrate-binding protein